MPPPISYLEVARLPLPAAAVPVGLAFSPSGRVLSYLDDPDGGLERRLYLIDLSGPGESIEVPFDSAGLSEEGLSFEEQLRRERAREVGRGVTSATFAAEVDMLLVPLPDGVYVVGDLERRPLSPRAVRLLETTGGDPIETPRLAPDGSAVAFSRGGELEVLALSGGARPVRLTSGASDGLSHGVAEYVAQEEMGRGEGLWWSKDSRLLAYTEVDERHVPVYRIVHQGSDETGPAAEETHRYPFAGGPNALVRLAVVPAAGGEPVLMDTGAGERYLARVHWLADGRLLAELQSRDQRRLELVAFDPAAGSGTVVHVEEQEPYLNLGDDFFELAGGAFLWSSERSGFRHLELRSSTGELVRVLTGGDWQVDALEGVDETAGLAYFSATRDGPTERHLYSVPLTGGAVERLSEERGTHRVLFSRSGTHYVDTHSALDSPPVVRVVSAAERRPVLTLRERPDPRLAGLGLAPPELVSFPAEDGTQLFGLLYRTSAPGAEPPPLVVQVYGGPAVQRVVDDWSSTTAMRAQALARLGCNVLAVDNRGSARRGLAFESAVWRRLGEVEVADQVTGVAWAVSEGLADPRRVGVFGWSYGGYMTLQLLARAPEVFRAGVAGAPVTDWDGYDTHYTERYMGTPAENPTGYAESSVLSHVSSMTGRLLLVHGLLDENVHFRHTARLVDHLIAARRHYELLVFPRERHLPRHLEDRAYMEERAISWLVGELSPESPGGA